MLKTRFQRLKSTVWLLSTINPNPPDEDMWIRPQVHPCQKCHNDIPENEVQSDYVDLSNMVQRHTRCSTNYCPRKNLMNPSSHADFIFHLTTVIKPN